MAIQWRTRSPSSRSGKSRQAGGGCLILFGLVFGGMGAAAFFFMGKMALNEAETYQWTETPCRIENCEIKADSSREDDPFQIQVRYSYQLDGRQFTSEQYTLQDNWTDDYEDLALERKALLAPGEITCFVEPENPAYAVLKREGLKTGLLMLIPLVFLFIGVGIIWGGIRAIRAKKAAGSGANESISAQAGKKAGGWMVGAALGFIFFLVGAGLLYPLGIKPVMKMSQSRHWVETPCKVIWSKVRSHRSDDGTTYSVDIFYEYEVNGETHRSNNYGFFKGSSSGRAGKKEIVQRHKPGSRQICYVNPKLPEQAVLRRGFSPMAFLALLPVTFTIAGLAVLIACVRSGRKSRAGAGPEDFSQSVYRTSDTEAGSELRSGPGPQTSASEFDGGPLVLKPGGKRMATTFGVLFFALFWNGIVSVFLYQLIKGFQRGSPDWFLAVFLIPFVLVGLIMIGFFFYQLLALANPRPVLTINPGAIRLGEPFEVDWQLSGSTSRLSSLKLSIRGLESATYRRGTNTHTSREVFFADEIASISHILEMHRGQASATIPADLMYSFKTDNNRVQYEIRIEGSIPFWPDVNDTHEFAILPAAKT